MSFDLRMDKQKTTVHKPYHILKANPKNENKSKYFLSKSYRLTYQCPSLPQLKHLSSFPGPFLLLVGLTSSYLLDFLLKLFSCLGSM